MSKKRRSSLRLYNVMMPLWLLWILPQGWLFILPANFVIDSVVLIAAMFCLKITAKAKNYKASILKVWIGGFFADLLGVSVLFLIYCIGSALDGSGKWGSLADSISTGAFNPFYNLFTLAYTVLAVLISGFAIYGYNKRWALKKLDIDDKSRKGLALAMALFTAPYTFLIPSYLLYQ